MKNALLFSLALATAGSASAQGRYLEQTFQPEVVDTLIPYGTNITVLPVVLGQSTTPQPQSLGFRLYRPAEDEATQRPVVIIMHTGSYMPIPLNGGLTGSINDAAVQELGQRFAALGYVVATPEYRQGWNITAPDVDEQTKTLLIASLRGSQDLHMLERYFRKTVEEDGNPYGIDPDRMMAIGLGTGGYNVLNGNFLDRVEEVNSLEKFIDSRDGLPYYDSTLYGNPYGTDQTQLNLPNWPAYDNGVALTVNLGGAMGDESWIEGKESESPVLAMHSTADANAPFGIGNILVPTTGNTVLQNSPGSRVVVGAVNDNGTNDVLTEVNAQLLADGDFITQRIEDLKDVPFTTRSGYETTYSTENMYPFVKGATERFANEYNYADTSLLGPPVRKAIADNQLPFTFDQLVQQESASNRNFLNPAAARMNLDTIMSFIVPRAYAVLDLAALVSAVDLSASQAGLTVNPNPARTTVRLSVGNDLRIEEVQVINLHGQRVLRHTFAGEQVDLDVSAVPSGMHYLIIKTSGGTVADKLMVD